MKKALIIIVSLLSVSSLACFAGCNVKGDGEKQTGKDGLQTKIITEQDDGTVSNRPDGTCPDGSCGEKRMPKVHFEFKNGRPAEKDENGDVIHRGWKRRHSHEKPAPLPPEDGGIEN